jgi:periplasmic divalent cation tolerance protein
MEKPLLVYSTFPDMASAERAATTLVAARLAACVNLIPQMHSVYAWKGAIETAREVVAIIKTREGRAEEVRAHLRANHPYETPIILYVAASGGDPDTLSWLFGATGAAVFE